MMPEEATINDFLAQLHTMQSEAVERIRGNAKAHTARNAARGLLRSGATLKGLADLIEREFESTLTQILDALRHARSLPHLDAQVLRDQTFLRASDLIKMLIGACDMEKWYTAIGRGAVVDVIRGRLDKLFPRLQFRMRQFEVGLDQPASIRGTSVTHNTVNVHTNNGVVQQAGDGATLHADTPFDVEQIARAISQLETAIARTNEPESRQVRQLATEIAMIKAQLAAPEPRLSIIREAGKSIRSIAEQAVAGALSPSIISASMMIGTLVR